MAAQSHLLVDQPLQIWAQQLQSRPKRRGEHFFCKSKVHLTSPYSHVWFYLVTIPHLVLFDPFSAYIVHFDVGLPSLGPSMAQCIERCCTSLGLHTELGLQRACSKALERTQVIPSREIKKRCRALVKCTWPTWAISSANQYKKLR